jgi:hypothetical protein
MRKFVVFFKVNKSTIFFTLCKISSCGKLKLSARLKKVARKLKQATTRVDAGEK